jgi:hypothetical protein
VTDQPFRREAGSGATPKSSVDLVQWLTEQIDQDEQVARAATAGPWTAEGNSSILGPLGRQPRLAGYVVCSVGAYDVGRPTEADAAHIVRHDPSRALRQVAAYRRILARHRPVKVMNNDGVRVAYVECSNCVENDGNGMDGAHSSVGWPCPDVRDLASIYADRPGFDPSWTVE